MALALTIIKHWTDGKVINVIGTLVASGNYTTGGDTIPHDMAVKTSKAPMFISFNLLSKYIGSQNGSKMKLMVPDTGLELAQAAYPVALTGDTITFHAVFPR